MYIYPSIDLMGGRVVRLVEGKRDQVTVFDTPPAELAAGFRAAGARRIHVVDLDGAFTGKREGAGANREAIEAIRASGVAVQIGGGVRDLATIATLLDAGFERVVLGTAMIETPELVIDACAQFPSRVVVAVDARDGKVAVRGWTDVTGRDAFEVAAEAAEAGCAAILYTDIRRDGTRKGPAIEETARLARSLWPVEVIASGGIGSLADLRALAAEEITACVVGRALAEKTFSLEDAMVAAGERGIEGEGDRPGTGRTRGRHRAGD